MVGFELGMIEVENVVKRATVTVRALAFEEQNDGIVRACTQAGIRRVQGSVQANGSSGQGRRRVA